MDFKEIVDSRRAVNFFDPERPVSDALIQQMVEMAAKAPSSTRPDGERHLMRSA